MSHRQLPARRKSRAAEEGPMLYRSAATTALLALNRAMQEMPLRADSRPRELQNIQARIRLQSARVLRQTLRASLATVPLILHSNAPPPGPEPLSARPIDCNSTMRQFGGKISWAVNLSSGVLQLRLQVLVALFGQMLGTRSLCTLSTVPTSATQLAHRAGPKRKAAR